MRSRFCCNNQHKLTLLLYSSNNNPTLNPKVLHEPLSDMDYKSNYDELNLLLEEKQPFVTMIGSNSNDEIIFKYSFGGWVCEDKFYWIEYNYNKFVGDFSALELMKSYVEPDKHKELFMLVPNCLRTHYNKYKERFVKFTFHAEEIKQHIKLINKWQTAINNKTYPKSGRTDLHQLMSHHYGYIGNHLIDLQEYKHAIFMFKRGIVLDYAGQNTAQYLKYIKFCQKEWKIICSNFILKNGKNNKQQNIINIDLDVKIGLDCKCQVYEDILYFYSCKNVKCRFVKTNTNRKCPLLWRQKTCTSRYVGNLGNNNYNNNNDHECHINECVECSILIKYIYHNNNNLNALISMIQNRYTLKKLFIRNCNVMQKVNIFDKSIYIQNIMEFLIINSGTKMIKLFTSIKCIKSLEFIITFIIKNLRENDYLGLEADTLRDCTNIVYWFMKIILFILHKINNKYSSKIAAILQTKYNQRDEMLKFMLQKILWIRDMLINNYQEPPKHIVVSGQYAYSFIECYIKYLHLYYISKITCSNSKCRLNYLRNKYEGTWNLKIEVLHNIHNDKNQFECTETFGNWITRKKSNKWYTCKVCKKVKYCSRKCGKIWWKKYHNYECSRK